MADLRPLIIVGAGDFGREVASLVNNINTVEPVWNILGHVDDHLTGITSEGLPILGGVSCLNTISENKPYIIVAIADSQIRKQIAIHLESLGYPFATLVHPSVIVSGSLQVGVGSIICAGTVFAINTQVGRHCIINLQCTLGHDVILEDFVSLMPGTNLAGKVHIKEGCYFGLNSCVINDRVIGEWTIVGAGAAVVRDLPARVVAVGVPARSINNPNR